jgi:hypothetical protein
MRSKPRTPPELVLGDEDHTETSKGALTRPNEVNEYLNLSLGELEAAEAAMHPATVGGEKSQELVRKTQALAIELPESLIPTSVFKDLGRAVEGMSMHVNAAIQPFIEVSRQAAQNHLQGSLAITKVSNDFAKTITDMPRIGAALEHIDLLGNENREAINQIASAMKPAVEQFAKARTEMNAAIQHLSGYMSSGLPTLSLPFCGLGTASNFSQFALGSEFDQVLSGMKKQFQGNQKLLDGLPRIGAANEQWKMLLQDQQTAIRDIASTVAPQIAAFAKLGETTSVIAEQIGTLVRGITESTKSSGLQKIISGFIQGISSFETKAKGIKRLLKYFKRRIGYLTNFRIRPIIGGDLLELPISALTVENILLLINEVLETFRALSQKLLLERRKLAFLETAPKAHPSPRTVDVFLKTHPPPPHPIFSRPAVQPNAPAC